MSTGLRLRQVVTIARLQLRRVFFSRRSFWVYLLALFPAVIFFGHGLEVKFTKSRLAGRSTPAAASVIAPLSEGDVLEPDELIERLGPPVDDNTIRWGPRDNQRERRLLHYFDGRRHWRVQFEKGAITRQWSRLLVDFDEDRLVFAGVFQYFYLRLAIFFGCLGIFMNLFRGEMLDKTLHFWFLIPARREVLLAGKYLAGLIAAVLIFTSGAVLCFLLMLWPQDAAAASSFWQNQGPSHLFWYAAAAALACVGYGSVFLAAGLLLRNPIIPAIVILLWESINGILPDVLQQLSVLYYVQSLTPVPAPMEQNAPLLIRLLTAPAEPPSTMLAVCGLLAVTVLVLWAASRAVRRLEINYDNS